MIQKLVPTPAFVIREKKYSRFDGQQHQKLAWSLVIIASLLIISTIIFAPMLHVNQYNAKAAPVVEQLENEMRIMRTKAFDPEQEPSLNGDYGVLNDHFVKQRKQLDQSQTTLDNLRRNLGEAKVGIGARAQHAEVIDLITTFDAVIKDSRSAIEIKLTYVEANRTISAAEQRLQASFNDPTAPYAEAVAEARTAQETAQGLADSFRTLDTSDQSKRLVELSAEIMQQYSDGYSLLIAALEKENAADYLATMQQRDTDIDQTSKEIIEESNKQLKDSELTNNFKKFDAQIEKVKASF